MLDRTEEFASKHLGKKSIGSEYYDPSLLVVVPRCENRKHYNIHNEMKGKEKVGVFQNSFFKEIAAVG